MMSVTEAARTLGLTRRGVLLRIEKGEMTAERVGPKFYLISRAEIERWKAIGKRKGGRPPKAKASA